MNTVDEIAEQFLDDLRRLTKETPNNADLGAKIRSLVESLEGLDED